MTQNKCEDLGVPYSLLRWQMLQWREVLNHKLKLEIFTFIIVSIFLQFTVIVDATLTYRSGTRQNVIDKSVLPMTVDFIQNTTVSLLSVGRGNIITLDHFNRYVAAVPFRAVHCPETTSPDSICVVDVQFFQRNISPTFSCKTAQTVEQLWWPTFKPINLRVFVFSKLSWAFYSWENHTRVRPKVETLTKSAQSWDSGIFCVGLAHSRVHKIQQKIL